MRLRDCCVGTYTGSMRRLLGIVALLLLISGAAPVFACVTDGATTREQSACCQGMPNNCQALAKMSCCRTDLRTDEQPQVYATGPSADHVWVVSDWLAPADISPRVVASSSPGRAWEHSPPGMLATRTTVLQI